MITAEAQTGVRPAGVFEILPGVPVSSNGWERPGAVVSHAKQETHDGFFLDTPDGTWVSPKGVVRAVGRATMAFVGETPLGREVFLVAPRERTRFSGQAIPVDLHGAYAFGIEQAHLRAVIAAEMHHLITHEEAVRQAGGMDPWTALAQREAEYAQYRALKGGRSAAPGRSLALGDGEEDGVQKVAMALAQVNQLVIPAAIVGSAVGAATRLKKDERGRRYQQVPEVLVRTSAGVIATDLLVSACTGIAAVPSSQLTPETPGASNPFLSQDYGEGSAATFLDNYPITSGNGSAEIDPLIAAAHSKDAPNFAALSQALVRTLGQPDYQWLSPTAFSYAYVRAPGGKGIEYVVASTNQRTNEGNPLFLLGTMDPATGEPRVTTVDRREMQPIALTFADGATHPVDATVYWRYDTDAQGNFIPQPFQIVYPGRDGLTYFILIDPSDGEQFLFAVPSGELPAEAVAAGGRFGPKGGLLRPVAAIPQEAAPEPPQPASATPEQLPSATSLPSETPEPSATPAETLPRSCIGENEATQRVVNDFLERTGFSSLEAALEVYKVSGPKDPLTGGNFNTVISISPPQNEWSSWHINPSTMIIGSMRINISGRTFGPPGEQVTASPGDFAVCMLMVPPGIGEPIPVVGGIQINGEWLPVPVFTTMSGGNFVDTQFHSPESLERWVFEHISVTDDVTPGLSVRYSSVGKIIQDDGHNFYNPSFQRAVALLGGTPGSYLMKLTQGPASDPNLKSAIAALDPKVDIGFLTPSLSQRSKWGK